VFSLQIFLVNKKTGQNFPSDKTKKLFYIFVLHILHILHIICTTYYTCIMLYNDLLNNKNIKNVIP